MEKGLEKIMKDSMMDRAFLQLVVMTATRALVCLRSARTSTTPTYARRPEKTIYAKPTGFSAAKRRPSKSSPEKRR